ncbi:tetratricopeptide repeat-containing glycosyltransferase family 2 protein [Paenibacillus aceti]|nr:glycosyltransferase family 2 protein [Paenibacillus aceti]
MVKNEEHNIKDCLNSVAQYADEILVVDNGSTDKTLDILKDFGCKVIYSDEYYFDRARNLYLEQATGEWILAIDADERLTSEGMKQIRKFISNAPQIIMGAYLPFYQYLGTGRWAYIEMMRLFRNHDQIRYNDKKIHPSPRPSIDKLGGVIHRGLYSPIHHMDSLDGKRTSKKREKYIKLSMEEIKDPGIQVLLGNEYIAVGEYKKAEVNLEKVILSQAPSDIRNRAALHLAQLYILQDDFDKASFVLDNIKTANVQFQSKIHTASAMNYMKFGLFEKALSASFRAIEKDPNAAHNYLNIGVIYDRLGDSKADEYYYSALKLNPYLLNPVIYCDGDSPNPYLHQNVVIESNLERILACMKNK